MNLLEGLMNGWKDRGIFGRIIYGRIDEWMEGQINKWKDR